jgi:hypothetical protein
MLASELHRPEILLAVALVAACAIGYLLRHVARAAPPSTHDPVPRAIVRPPDKRD